MTTVDFAQLIETCLAYFDDFFSLEVTAVEPPIEAAANFLGHPAVRYEVTPAGQESMDYAVWVLLEPGCYALIRGYLCSDTPMQCHVPLTIALAHQYLYYVLNAPQITDGEYDTYCRRHALHGGGGSDRAEDYPHEARLLAHRWRNNPNHYAEMLSR